MGVTGNTLEPLGGYATPPAALSKDAEGDVSAEMAVWLDTAAPLALDSIPSTMEARALMTALVGMVLAQERKRRGPKLQAKLTDAVGAVVGGLLKNWGRVPSRPVFRSGKAASFSDGPIPYRQFAAAVGGLERLGLVIRQPGYRRAIDWDDSKSWSGKAARLWPSAELLRLAADHGIAPGDTREHFATPAPVRPPTVRKLVSVTSLKRTIGFRTGQAVRNELEDTALGAELQRVRKSIEEANAFAAEHDVRGCLPPRWKRVFTVNAMLGGRWIAVGKEGVYQTMPESERLARITINGEPVVEVDLRASHLSIMHGLLGLPLPDGDPYVFPEVPRWVAKAWITATLGKGSPVTKWAARASKANPQLRDHNARTVGQIICERFPFMRRPAMAVAAPAGLDRLTHIGTPARLLTHRLMAIEAQALTGVMDYLRVARGVLALPIHDSLLVARSGVGHVGGAFDGSFGAFAKVRPRWTVEQAPEMPCG